jgi:hypothetical protein
MNFYAVGGTHVDPTILTLNLDKAAQDELTAMFAPIVKATKTADTVPFDPSYRPDAGEIVTVASYTLPSGLAPLIDADSVAILPALNANPVGCSHVCHCVAHCRQARRPKTSTQERMAFRRVCWNSECGWCS